MTNQTEREKNNTETRRTFSIRDTENEAGTTSLESLDTPLGMVHGRVFAEQGLLCAVMESRNLGNSDRRPMFSLCRSLSKKWFGTAGSRAWCSLVLLLCTVVFFFDNHQESARGTSGSHHCSAWRAHTLSLQTGGGTWRDPVILTMFSLCRSLSKKWFGTGGSRAWCARVSLLCTVEFFFWALTRCITCARVARGV